jgi:hypothetical protein
LFIRGDHEQSGQEATPSELTVLSGDNAAKIPLDDPNLPTAGRRLAYAKWLTSGRHPLVARVIVNRVWMQHFGRGLVATPGDFGMLGERPTHPELLDWLADEFVWSGWSLKRLHRLMMNSTAYRQSSRREAASEMVDSENTLYWRMNVRRLEGEALRDGVLAATAQLNVKSGGPPIPIMADRVGQFVIGIENLNAGRPGAEIPLHGEEFRRSVYVQVRRSRPLAVLETFDLPAMTPNCTARKSTTSAPQSLLLMNGEFLLEQSRRLAERLVNEIPGDSAERIRRAWRATLARTPSEDEVAAAEKFLREQQDDFAANPDLLRPAKKSEPTMSPPVAALASVCQALLSCNEFLYID